MNEVKILKQIFKNTEERLFQVISTIDKDMYIYFDTIIKRLKEESVGELEGETFEKYLILVGYMLGMAIQQQKSPNPLINHIKDNNLIAVEFEFDGKKGGVFVSKTMTNSQIKKEIQKIVGMKNGKWNGNFRKLSEFEQAREMKNINDMLCGKTTIIKEEIK